MPESKTAHLLDNLQIKEWKSVMDTNTDFLDWSSDVEYEGLDNVCEVEEALAEYENYIKRKKKRISNTTKKEKDTTMNDDINEQRLHLKYRAADVHLLKHAELKEHFKIIPKQPYGDLQKVEWFEKKWFEIVEEKDSYNPGKTIKRLIWRDPTHIADTEGFSAANRKLREAYTAVMDDIKIKTPEAALESLRAFEKATFI